VADLLVSPPYHSTYRACNYGPVISHTSAPPWLQASANHRVIIIKDLRVNHGKLVADTPAQEQHLAEGFLQLKLNLAMRMAPDAGAAVLRCDEAPVMKLYGGAPRKLELVQGAELKELLQQVLAELPDDSDEEQQQQQAEEQPEEEAEYGCKGSSVPMVSCSHVCGARPACHG
jgi:hypothetical protein